MNKLFEIRSMLSIDGHRKKVVNHLDFRVEADRKGLAMNIRLFIVALVRMAGLTSDPCQELS